MRIGMKAYARHLRQKILRACDQRCGSQRAIAARSGSSQSFVGKPLRRRRDMGDIAPRPHAGGRQASSDAAALLLVRRVVQAQPDATPAALCAQLSAQRGLQVSVPTMSRIAKQLGLARTTHRFLPASRIPQASNKRARTTGS
jgi:transposase